MYDEQEGEVEFKEAGYENFVDPSGVPHRGTWCHPAAPHVTIMYEDGFIVSAPGSITNIEYGELTFTDQNLSDLATLSALNT